MTGKLTGLTFNADGTQNITVTVSSDFRQEYDSLKDTEVEISIKKYFKKRSRDANAYCWELCGKIADKLSDDGELHTKEDVYREAIRNVGVYRDIPMLTEGVDTLREAWQRHGTGWITEQVDYLRDADGYLIRCYFGSSVYNAKQMSRLLDNLIQDCDALGIEHRTPDEIEKLKSLWASAPAERT